LQLYANRIVRGDPKRKGGFEQRNLHEAKSNRGVLEIDRHIYPRRPVKLTSI
jgi:hypothetical protein